MILRTRILAPAMALILAAGPAMAGLVKVESAKPSDGTEVRPPSPEAPASELDRHDAIEAATGPVSPSGRHAVPWGTEPPPDDETPIDPQLGSGGSGGGDDPVPEPTTIALLGLGLVSMAGGSIARRRRNRSA